VARSVELFNEDREAWHESLHPDFVMATDPGWPDGGEFRGREEALGFVRKFVEAWSEVVLKLESFEELGVDGVLTRARWITQGSASGIASEIAFSIAWRVDAHCKVTECRFFFGYGKARELLAGS
jgi:hypothetical protein